MKRQICRTWLRHDRALLSPIFERLAALSSSEERKESRSHNPTINKVHHHPSHFRRCITRHLTRCITRHPTWQPPLQNGCARRSHTGKAPATQIVLDMDQTDKSLLGPPHTTIPTCACHNQLAHVTTNFPISVFGAAHRSWTCDSLRGAFQLSIGQIPTEARCCFTTTVQSQRDTNRAITPLSRLCRGSPQSWNH
jgi:hypothetical protein